jgi:hypothetical protein
MTVKSIVHCGTNNPFSLREKARMRGYKIRQLTARFYPLSPSLSRSTRLIAGYKEEGV